MRNSGAWWWIALFMFLLDLYVFQAVKWVCQPYSDRTRIWVYGIYWSISLLALVMIVSFPFLPSSIQLSKVFRNYVFSILVGIFFAKLMAALFFLIDDVRRGGMWLVSKIFPATGASFGGDGNVISRSTFLSWAGLALGSGFFGTMLYGFRNKYNYQVKRVPVSFNNLPEAFKGLKLVQISDIHCGSLQDMAAVEKGVELILKEKPDVICFTGDLVNDRHEEVFDCKPIFSKLQAPMGVYSILGNHDYGDYVRWESAEQKASNLDKLKQLHQEMGWRLLMNEHVVLEKEGQQMAILGIENWSAKGRFPKYGKLAEAYEKAKDIPFKVLLSHDPSHWDAEVLPNYKDIDLTLSGHTHGMQFGLENPYFKWSPVQWVYPRWAGLYEERKQKLYINRGFGFIGYPGRVGILPEITVIEFV